MLRTGGGEAEGRPSFSLGDARRNPPDCSPPGEQSSARPSGTARPGIVFPRPRRGGAWVRVFFPGGLHMAVSWLHRLLKGKSGPAPRAGRKKVWRNRFVPSLEGLGERIVPSTF